MQAELDRVLQPELSHYEVLRIAPGRVDDPVWLSRARKAVAMICHPDRWVNEPADLQQRASDAMARVNAAYDVLSDTKARKRYDMTAFAKAHKLCPKCKGFGSFKQQHGFNKIRFHDCVECAGSGVDNKEKK